MPVGMVSGSASSENAPKWALTLGYTYENNRIPIRGSDIGPNVDKESSLFRSIVPQLTYRPGGIVAYTLILPYKDIVSPKSLGGDPNKRFRRHFSGVGDAILVAEVQGKLPERTGLEVSYVIGASLPTGSADPDHEWRAADGSTIQSHDPVLQPGHRTFDPIIGIRLEKDWGNSSAYGTFIHRFSGGRNAYDYTVGAESQLALGLRTAISGSTGANVFFHFVQLGFDNDYTRTGRIANTGGTWGYFTQEVTMKTGSDSSLKAALQVPVFRNTHGNILNPEWVLHLAATWNLDRTPDNSDTKEVSTGSEFNIQEHLVPGKLTLFEFYATDCKVSNSIQKEKAAILRKHPNVALRRINVTRGGRVLAQHGVEATPDLRLYSSDGTLILSNHGDLNELLEVLDSRKT